MTMPLTLKETISIVSRFVNLIAAFFILSNVEIFQVIDCLLFLDHTSVESMFKQSLVNFFNCEGIWD